MQKVPTPGKATCEEVAELLALLLQFLVELSRCAGICLQGVLGAASGFAWAPGRRVTAASGRMTST